ncbi:uncharacterized protein A1O9_07260 [Exophiala aquamarina CBS 119918]|uniref:Uncharacterized protein n=1 Tax=Exophiala aquamarina CBS 119918 TaxID=1182545 RepID=A0A072PNF7_9EURO|nr:uncharacterized protein A1O9_07260 [Exophiala aquamarina CBS 119918]KEF57070.1 hypothetical protein A1O9_07260 [Exophiala aquamarina CBS 119918]
MVGHMDSRLWYNRPSDRWTDALPVGNGKLGAMIYGIPDHERIQLNEESVWSGGKRSRLNQNASESLVKVRQLLCGGDVEAAERLADLGMASTPVSMRHYESLGEMKLTFDAIPKSLVKEYERWLDLETAVAGVKFSATDTLYEREIFASAPDNIIVQRHTAKGIQRLSFHAMIHRPYEMLNVAYDTSYNDGKDTAFMIGTSGGSDPITFAAAINIQTDGKIEALGEFLLVEDATEAIILFTAATTYRTPDPITTLQKTLDRSKKHSYSQLRSRHVEDYQALFRSCTLQLGHPEPSNSRLPTDKRVEALRNGESDVGLLALQFQYGRYLLISCSRPGTLPANLQGIWNKDYMSAWGSKYTININTEMNYWLAEVTNLSTLHSPLFDHIETICQSGRQTALKMYNASGWVVHHNTDIWGDSAPQDRWPAAAYWTLASAWLCTHILDHFLFTGDTDFLLGKIDTMSSAIDFFLDTLQPVELNDKAYFVTNPSVSPENVYFTATDNVGAMTIGPACDFQILRQFFNGFVSAVSSLPENPVDPSFILKIQETVARFPPTQISQRYPGVIQEWLHDYREAEPGHRHISHLYALYPGTQILPPGSSGHDATIWDAANRTIEHRLANGGAGTGWSRAWTINWYARLLNGEEVARHISEFFTQSTYLNLFDAHPPFQVDGNFGFTSGVAEALLQSHFIRLPGNVREVWLLPALPASWGSGLVKGLVARGSFVINIHWEDGIVKNVEMESRLGGTIVVRYDMQGRKGVKVIPRATYDGFKELSNGRFELSTRQDETYSFTIEYAW